MPLKNPAANRDGPAEGVSTNQNQPRVSFWLKQKSNRSLKLDLIQIFEKS
jgi:hypothetical protein